jgi:hypothetical protein
MQALRAAAPPGAAAAPSLRPAGAVRPLQCRSVRRPPPFSAWPGVALPRTEAAPHLACRAAAAAGAAAAVRPESEVEGMAAFLDSLKYNKDGLVAVIVQVGVVHRG